MVGVRRSLPNECEIKVEFLKASAGWLYFRVTLDDQSLAISATHWMDPFPEIVESLEAIADRQKNLVRDR
jgi:hypothetical protein